MALLPQDPQKQKLVLAGLLPVLLAFGYYYFYHTKRVTEAEALQENVERLEVSNAGMQQIIGRYGADFQQRLAVYQAHLGQLEELIPRREDVPVLISQITSRAEEIGVQLAALNPAAELPGEFYSRQSYEIQVLGTYHSIGEYMTAIGSLPRIVKSTALKLNTDQPATEAGESPTLRASFNIETFIVPDPGMVADTAAVAGVANANG
ncbi:MAG TPA: type 4a pilus biogenesis protein PilO [Longimicrobiales bacterium]|nr:type 4a pilus biogenesis protein PilO [Longimicrobiales bacterium]